MLGSRNRELRTFNDLVSDVLYRGKDILMRSPKWKDRVSKVYGFVPCIINDQTGELLIHQEMGVLRDNGDDPFGPIEYAYEKSTRLFRLESVSSMETRDENQNAWGGGIRADLAPVAFSISAFPEVVDEAFCLRIADRLNFISEARIQQVLGVHGDTSAYDALLQGGF